MVVMPTCNQRKFQPDTIAESDADLIIEDGGKIVPKMGGYSSVFQDLKNDEIVVFSRPGSLTVKFQYFPGFSGSVTNATVDN